MKARCALLTLIASSNFLSGCAPAPPVVTAVETICNLTTQYHATPEQKAAFSADKAMWEPLVDWLLDFYKVRKPRCEAGGPR